MVEQSLPEGETIDAEMLELAKVVQSESFKNCQKEFFTKHCQSFDAEEENKLEYTTIYKEYEEMVEGQIRTQMGEEKLLKLEMGMAQYIKANEKSGNQSQDIFEALEILSQLGDFVVFKKLMLLKKDEANGKGSGGLQIVDKGVITVDTIPEYMERLEKLR